MPNITSFLFEGKEVRFVGTADCPEWIAQDVCACLELADTSKALSTLKPEEKGTNIVRTLGGEQELLTVKEPGLYRLVFKSRKAAAERFKDWVFHEVLPSIRATGKYDRTQGKPALPPHQEAKEVAETIVYIHEYLTESDPRLAQILIDRAMQTVQAPPQLASSDPVLAGAVEIAEGLGFKVGKEQSMLGKIVAKEWRKAYGSDPQSAKRECGGAFRNMKVYPSDDPIVVGAIKAFYSSRETA